MLLLIVAVPVVVGVVAFFGLLAGAATAGAWEAVGELGQGGREGAGPARLRAVSGAVEPSKARAA